MFINESGKIRIDAERLAEQIKNMPGEEREALDDRKGVLRDALNAFEAQLERLSSRERQATLSLFYKKITETAFDFHLSLETSSARKNIQQAKTRKEKEKAYESFRAVTEDLAILYGKS